MHFCRPILRSKSIGSVHSGERGVSGEMFIESGNHYKVFAIGTRCWASRPNRWRTLKAGGYKHFAPTALTVLIALASIFTNGAPAQRRTPATIPSPRSVLGFNPGDDRTIADWKQISDYFARLDSASDRVQLQTLGKSTLGRTMFVAFISAPENIRNLEKYKGMQAKLADPRRVASDTDRDQLIRDGKTVVTISC